MRSRAEPAARRGGSGASARTALESLLRLVALAAIAMALFRALRPAAEGGVERARGAEIPAALARWSADPELASAHVSFDSVPPPGVRDWLAALRGAGVRLSYDISAPAPLAVAVEQVPDPSRPSRVLVAAPPAALVEVDDALGRLDTLRAGADGAQLVGSALASPVAATVRGVTARAVVADSLVLRPLVVLGRAGWESKFTVAALEERGWTVVARMVVAPDVDVEQGALPPLDTARVAAVIALDETAGAMAPAIARYVASGGGLVLGAEAARLPALAAIAPARPGAAQPLHSDALAGADARRGLPLGALTALRGDALVLERRDDVVAVAARRAGAGRVVQLGYQESWRWRMAGPAGSPEAHRAWWGALVSGVAHAPPAPSGTRERGAPLDDAPLSRLIAAVGAPGQAPTAGPAGPQPAALPWWAMAVAVGALLGEWASRRLRGMR